MTLYDYSRNDLFSLNYNLIHQCAFFSQNISLFSESDFSPPHHNTLKCLLEKVDEVRFSKIIVRIWGKRTFFPHNYQSDFFHMALVVIQNTN